MNIFGIGTDIVNIKRIQNSLKKNENFKKRIFIKLLFNFWFNMFSGFYWMVHGTKWFNRSCICKPL